MRVPFRGTPTSRCVGAPPSDITVKADAMEPDDTTVERGSGNVFADLGSPDADAHLVKAELVSSQRRTASSKDSS